MDFQIECLTVGQIDTNCYLAVRRDTKELLIVDPGDEEERIEHVITYMEGRPVAILLTHGHFDHILAAEGLKAKYRVPIYACQEEEDLLLDPSFNMSSRFGDAFTLSADRYLSDGQEVTLAGTKVCCYHTPGHTPGGCCFYLPEEGILFSGDTLFYGSVGRTDFPGGNGFDLKKSLLRLVSLLPEDTKVYPGHGPDTTIDYEKRLNPYVTGQYML
ncbi:MAG: MBL fold metallo-hydrolase [Blautia sp.]|nr:MBL fold metallo-hydrolase [Blautia sp.]